LRRRIFQIKEAKEIIKKALVCRLAVCEDSNPYIIPVCFGYKNGFLYIHSAPEGKKIEILKKNKKVCFEIDIIEDIVSSDLACEWDIKYESVIGFGEAFFIENLEEKKEALKCIFKHYSKSSPVISEDEIRKVTIIGIKIKNMTCKKSYGE
jgi:hypothetical protein